MDQQRNDSSRTPNPRRRKRSQLQIFKEAYLPILIAVVAILLIIVFIIGSVSRSIQRRKAETAASIAASSSLAEEQARLTAEAEDLVERAAELADQLDYKGAIDLLYSFSGDSIQYPIITDAIIAYEDAQSKLVAWEDPSQIAQLSFQLLIADPQRAFTNADYGSSYNKNFITTGEFSAILQQLYDNGYILVSLDDFLTTDTAADGSAIHQFKTLYLPEGKKPLMLTQTQVNYNTYMVDSDGDKLPDKNGAGFASRLVIDENGDFACEIVNADGTQDTGAYDLVPILEAFIKENPDFSYKGARAILAVTGYDGLFGYRTNPSAKNTFGEEKYSEEIAGAEAIIDALRLAGYDIACYTYSNVAYGERGAQEIQADLTDWSNEVTPILGVCNILVYAKNSDIAENNTYSGSKFTVLKNFGFQYYLGFCENGRPFAGLSNDYVRLCRLLVTGSNLAYHADWFAGMFDAATVLDSTRGTVPQ